MISPRKISHLHWNWRGLLSPEKEEIPPYFVQTLLESEDARFQAVEAGFEQKTCAHVFHRLSLHRRLFRSHRSSLRSAVNALPIRRSFMALIAACLLFMLLTIMMTGTSFASGIVFLLSGTHSGVVLIKSYPSGLDSPATPTLHQVQRKKPAASTKPKRIGLLGAQQQLHFPMHWPMFTPSNYSLNGIYLYQSQNQDWADGPILELDFDYALPGVSPHGSGKVVICEFKPQGKVFQVVQTGAAHQMTINPDESAQAIYVDGQWVPINQSSHDWIYGERSELIYEYNGIIFWIVGDQRDGINKDVLLQIATSLTTVDLEHFKASGRISRFCHSLS